MQSHPYDEGTRGGHGRWEGQLAQDAKSPIQRHKEEREANEDLEEGWCQRQADRTTRARIRNGLRHQSRRVPSRGARFRNITRVHRRPIQKNTGQESCKYDGGPEHGFARTRV